jgi:hypothetical protein
VSGPHLVALASQSQAVFEALLMMLGKDALVTAVKIIEAREHLKELVNQLCAASDSKHE